jgi:CRISPR/Cas system-associated exonuclease Cas4 (RecB family)
MAGNYWRERSKPYEVGQTAVFKVSRSKIELFMQCPRCFWLDVRLKITRPSGPPFQINKAIDELFKKEFDVYRAKAEPHPLMVDNQIKAIPYTHNDLDKWRHNFTGVTTLHEATNLHVFGAIDDVWVNDAGELIVVDYKATAKASEVSLDAEWQISYKRQMEVYQWLLRANGFDKVEFRTKVIPYTGDAAWVEPTLKNMKKCMEGDMPAVGQAAMGGDCDYCTYARARTELTLKHIQSKKGINPKKNI